MNFKEMWKSLNISYKYGLISFLIGLVFVASYFVSEFGKFYLSVFYLGFPYLLFNVVIGMTLCGYEGGGLLNCSHWFEMSLRIILPLIFLSLITLIGYKIGIGIQKTKKK